MEKGNNSMLVVAKIEREDILSTFYRNIFLSIVYLYCFDQTKIQPPTFFGIYITDLQTNRKE